LFERLTHGAGVVDRLLQLGHVLVVIVADDERDTLFGVHRLRERQRVRREANHQRGPDRQPIHHAFSRFVFSSTARANRPCGSR